jgi:hypothetical protein
MAHRTTGTAMGRAIGTSCGTCIRTIATSTTGSVINTLMDLRHRCHRHIGMTFRSRRLMPHRQAVHVESVWTGWEVHDMSTELERESRLGIVSLMCGVGRIEPTVD